MLRTATGEPDPVLRPRPQVKPLLLDMLKARGAEGVNADMVVEAAAQRNERIERGTVSSLLSRFKAEGLVFYDGKVYRLAKYASNASMEAPAMH